MYREFKAKDTIAAGRISKGKAVYPINDAYLFNLGFEKNEALSGPEEWVYRYYRPCKRCSGIELIYLREFGILSVEEFWLNGINGVEQMAQTIVGKFRVYCNEDLDFIFSRNIRLNYIFNVDGKRV